jgi:hypothetical protein
MRITWILLLFFLTLPSVAQVKLKGQVRDEHSETLPQAHLVILPDSITTASDLEGNFEFRLSPGIKTLQVSFVGYRVSQTTFQLRSDTIINPTLSSSIRQLAEVVIKGQRDFQQEMFDRNRTSTYVLSQDDINSIPVLGGEADVIKTLQLLPGTVKGVEGTSDLFVRGGAADQNLVLLDGAPIYNTSHLFGFLSVFNPDILSRVEAINGGFPAEFGGRLSSILDVGTVSSIPRRTQVSADIGLIASRLMVEQPLLRDKASIWISGRRTYIDQVVKATGEELPYFFYDLNGKIMLKPSAHDHVELSYYGGEDVLDFFRDRNNDGDGFLTRFTSGNNSQSLRWDHRGGDDLSTSFTAFHTAYRYNIRNEFEENQLVALSDIEDYGARFAIQKDSLPLSGFLKVGFDWTHHAVSPNVINSSGDFSEIIKSSTTSGRTAHEFASHAQFEFSPTPLLTVNTGLRFSGAVVSRRTYHLLEPRFAMTYSLNAGQSIKASYSKMSQYMHRISNSALSAPTDIWYPVTDSIRPQSSHQFALAWQRSFREKDLLLSVEGYYKSMQHLIGYEEGTNLFLNNDFESSLIQGRGRAYGLEFLFRKNAGKLTGWLSYTLSWSWRKFDQIQPEWFPARYDRRHNGAVVMQYALTKRWSVSAVWEYISGSRFTPVIGQYVVPSPSYTGVELIPIYSEINGVKLSDAHRLDFGIKFRSKPERKFQWHWFAGLYNVYNRTNPVGMNIVVDENDGSLRYEQPGLFGALPFISYGFKL